MPWQNSAVCTQPADVMHCRWFCQWLEESSKDFRVGAEALKELEYAVFGCGNSLYADNFNQASHLSKIKFSTSFHFTGQHSPEVLKPSGLAFGRYLRLTHMCTGCYAC